MGILETNFICQIVHISAKLSYSFSQKISQRLRALPPDPHSLLRPLSMIHLRHASLLITHPNLDFWEEVEPSPYSKILVKCQHSGHRL